VFNQVVLVFAMKPRD